MAKKTKPKGNRGAAGEVKVAGARTAGVREMKAHLSAYLRRVKDGETVTITERGEVIAQLTPPPAMPPGDVLEQTLDRLERAGKIIRPTISMAQLRASLRATASSSPAAPRGTVQRLLDEDREDRF